MSGLQTACLLLALCAFSFDPEEHSTDQGPTLFEVSPETTVVDGPFTPQGTVDYIAYLNQRCSTGVTIENNAAVLLCEAFGPGIFDSEVRESYFTQLGIAVPPEEGEYFIGREEFIRQTRAGNERALRDALQSAIEQPWTADDYPELVDWIAANALPLEIIEQASRRSQYFSPLVCGEEVDAVGDTILECVVSIEFAVPEAARLLCARGTRRIAEQDHIGGWNDIASAMRLARLVDREPRIISTLTAIGIQNSALKSLNVLLNVADPSDVDFSAVSAEFSEWELAPDYQAKFDESERFSIIGPLQEKAAQVGVNGRTDWNVALRTANGWFDDIVAMSAGQGARDIEAWAEVLDERVERTLIEVRGTPWYARVFQDRESSGKFEGDSMVVLLLPAVQNVARAAVRLEARQQLARIGLALAAYRARHETYPDDLSALVPDYLAELPIDPFGDAAPIYRLEDNGYVLYSLGPNFEDDDGAETDEAGDVLDIVLRVEHGE